MSTPPSASRPRPRPRPSRSALALCPRALPSRSALTLCPHALPSRSALTLCPHAAAAGRYLDPMKALDVDGAWLFTPQIHGDRRGSFLEWFRDAEFSADVGHSMDLAQANCSGSRRGGGRGIHFSAA